MTPIATALLGLLAELGADDTDEAVLLPANTFESLGCTERHLRYTLAALDGAGVLVWHRKRPGRPSRPGYPVTALVPLEKATAEGNETRG